MYHLRIWVLIVTFVMGSVGAAAGATLVPPGNRNTEQPNVPAASASRTKALRTTYEAKYRKVYNLLKGDRKLRSKISKVARQYGIDPMHIVGAIVGEHTFNVDAYDRLQTYYIKAAAYLSEDFDFSYDGEKVDQFIQRPQFDRCNSRKTSNSLWQCRENVWNRSFRGKTVDGKKFPNNRFSAVFFQPFYAGQTFGLGQLNPLTALMMTDMVNRVSRQRKLDHRKPEKVYETIMDPDKTLPYVAATLKTSIDAYRRIADYDISQNPGLTATLYNTGNPAARAYALKAKNEARVKAGQEPLMPQENYYGWWVNEKLPELKALF